MKPERKLFPRRRLGVPLLLRGLAAAAILSLAVLPGWAVRHIGLDRLVVDAPAGPVLPLVAVVHL